MSSPPDPNAPFSRKFSFRLVLSFEMCRSTSSPRFPSRQRPHRLISFLNDRPCKSRLELCSRIVSNPFMKVTSAEMPFPAPPKLRFKDPIFPNKPQFTFPQDVSTCSYDLVDFLCSEIPIFNLGRIRSSAFPRARNQITEINITCQHLSKSVLILVQSSFHMVGFSVLICFAKLPACSTTLLELRARNRIMGINIT
jgi:hypothetical protein